MGCDVGCNEKVLNKEFSYKTISDPLYGNIGLSEMEVDLLDTRAMQRLRRIKQMGFSSYVFPGGEHSRFVHSLGVLYIMGRMCEVLYRNGDLEFDDIVKLRAAALLHDVGHYPFSHLSEAVYSYIDAEAADEQIFEDQSSIMTLMRLLHNSKKQVL